MNNAREYVKRHGRAALRQRLDLLARHDTYPRAGQPYTYPELERIRRALEAGHRPADVAAMFGRSTQALEMMARKRWGTTPRQIYVAGIVERLGRLLGMGEPVCRAAEVLGIPTTTARHYALSAGWRHVGPMGHGRWVRP